MDFAKEVTLVTDLIGHLNLIHPNRIRMFGKSEATYYQRSSEESRKR